MIFKIKFENGVQELCVAKNIFHAIEEYNKICDSKKDDIISIKRVHTDEYKNIIIKNEIFYNEKDFKLELKLQERFYIKHNENNFLTLHDMIINDEFCILATNYVY